jgi:hypothetical protein
VCLIGFEFLQTCYVRFDDLNQASMFGRRLLTLLMLNVAIFMRHVSGRFEGPEPSPRTAYS